MDPGEQTREVGADEDVTSWSADYRAIVESIEDYAVILLDPAGTILTWNRGAERICGYGAREIVGRHVSSLYLAEEAAAGKPARDLAHAARCGRLEGEGWHVRKDGSRWWANVVIGASRDDGGRLRGFVRVARDHSERREAEQQIVEERVARAEAEATSRRLTAIQAVTDASPGALELAPMLHDLPACARAHTAISPRAQHDVQRRAPPSGPCPGERLLGVLASVLKGSTVAPSDSERTEPSQLAAQPGTGATREPDPSGARRDERVLVLAPTGSDAEILSAAATEGGFSVEIARDMASLCAAIQEGAGAVAIVEADFSPPEVEALREALRAQRPWSDPPLLLASADVAQEEARRRLLCLLGMLEPGKSVAILERPLQVWMLTTAFSNALHARRCQKEARALLEQLDLERRRGSAVLAALPVGIVVWDTAGRAIASNAAQQRIWGGMPPVERWEDLRIFKAWPAGTNREGAPFEWRMTRVLTTGQEYTDEELEIAAFDGVYRTVLSSAYPIHGTHGELVGVVAVQVDISERARTERARRLLSEASAAISEALEPGLTLRTLARIIVTNLADVCAIDEMDQKGELRRLVAETSGARSADVAARLLAFAPAASGNSLAVRVLRSARPLLVRDVPADWLWTGPHADEHKAALAEIEACSLMVLPLIARGRPLGVIGIISTRPDRRYGARDLALAEEISRRAAIALDNARLHREAEAAIRARDESLSELQAFLDASHVGFAVLDRMLRYQRINDVLAGAHSLPAEDHIGRALEDVLSNQVEAQLAPVLRRVLTTGEPRVDQAIVVEAPPGSGRRRHYVASFVPLLDVTGTPRAVGEIVTDVTPLTEAKEALREEVELREQFIGVLAHDLRTPLQAIMLSARSMVRQPDDPATCARIADRIEHAAGRMERMIGALLDLARSRQGGGMVITRAAADLADVARNVVAEIQIAHPSREIALSVQGDTRGELDADRMAQVISNLVGNAAAYSPAGTPVEVGVAGRQGELVLTVHNLGTPIPPRVQKAIFAPFRRSAPHPGHGSPSMHGLGLGLYIVGEITRAHGGTVEVTSTAEEGTTFTVRVPRARTAIAPAA